MLAGTAEETSDALMTGRGDASDSAAHAAAQTAARCGTTSCHGTAAFARMRMGRTGWENEVASMADRGAVWQEFRTVVEYLMRNFGN